MKLILLTAVLAIMFLALGVNGQIVSTNTPAAEELTKLLNEFLAGASRNDPVVHDHFWAEDVIYTGSARTAPWQDGHNERCALGASTQAW